MTKANESPQRGGRGRATMQENQLHPYYNKKGAAAWQ